MDQNRRYEDYEIYLLADALYESGWRAEDKDWMMEKYGYTEEEATLICKELQEIAMMDEEEEEYI